MGKREIYRSSIFLSLYCSSVRFLERGKIPEVVGCVDRTLVATIIRLKKLIPGETESN